MKQMFDHFDQLHEIERRSGLGDKLEYIHVVLCANFPFLARIAVALYDHKTDQLTTFVHSSGADNPLPHYTTKLSEAPSLQEILACGRPRVINDLQVTAGGERSHTQRILGQGYRASYTQAIYHRGQLFGFLFFNAYEADCFTGDVLDRLDPFAHLIALTVISELAAMYTLAGTVRAARDMAHARDEETGAHLDRMARYARLIAMAIADRHGLSDEQIEHIFLFAPLHDIGKIAIPDAILLKPAQLDMAERRLMQTHARRGRELVDKLLGNFGLEGASHIGVLRNIVEFHHETVDGAGYPDGLPGADIPIEARIVAVADVFDALTSERPYKRAWSNDDAFAMLEQLTETKLDGDCVAALRAHRAEVEAIQRQFRESAV